MANWLSKLVYGSQPGPSSASQQFTAASDRGRKVGTQMEGRFLQDNAAFDPRDAMKEYSQGAYSDFRAQLAKELEGLSGSAVGAGRFDSGFFDADRGEVVTELGRGYMADLNRQALNTAGMRQRQIEFTGDYGMRRTQDYQDMLAAQLDREQAERNARRQKKSGILGGLTKLAGAGIGFMAGGPVGAAAGYKMAGWGKE